MTLPFRDLETDVLVAGAGPAGATIARLLASAHLRVLLVDPLSSPLQRLEVLAPAAYPVLEALDLKPVLEKPGLACCCLGIRRRWGTSDVEVDAFLNRPGGRGLVIERSLFDEALRQEAIRNGARLIEGRVTGLFKEGRTISVKVRHPQRCLSIQAQLVVDATGRPAALARRFGTSRIFSERLVAEKFVSAQSRSYGARALWLEVKSERSGWTYSLSGPDGRRETWRVKRAGEGPGASSLQRLQTVDASSVYLSCAGGDGWIAVGDAAASFDPITSQGLINTLATSLVAAAAILETGDTQQERFESYSAAVAATFLRSEVGRKEVYQVFAS